MTRIRELDAFDCMMTGNEHTLSTAEQTDLPQFHLNGAVELDKSCLEVEVLAVRIVDVDCSLLVLVLVDVTKMSTKLSTYRHIRFWSNCNNLIQISVHFS